MIKYLSVALLTLGIYGHAFAQGNDADVADSYTADNAPAPDKRAITSKEMDAFKDALKHGSEAQVVKTAAVILSKDQNNLTALNGLGVHYLEAKKYGLAKIIFDRALKAYPKEPALHNNLGVIALQEGDMREALESFRKSLLGGDYRLGASNIASIYLENKDYKRAVGPLEDAYEKLKGDVKKGERNAVEVASNYGVALMGVGRGDEAKDVFETIVQSGSRDAVAYLNYAILLTEVLDKKKDAQRILSKLQFMTEDKNILRRAEELERRAQ